MSIPSQKTIEQYLDGKNVPQGKKEKIILAVTNKVYQRNQNVIKLEKETDKEKQEQFLSSIKEYDEMIDRKIKEILNGKFQEQIYDF